MVGKTERRKYPRIKNEDISVKLSGDGFNTISQSLDVSASGIYCKVDKQIPLMTRVQIVLSLPKTKGSTNSTILNIDGVVVRANSVVKNGKVQHYDLAIFFDCLSEREKSKLKRFIEKSTK